MCAADLQFAAAVRRRPHVYHRLRLLLADRWNRFFNLFLFNDRRLLLAPSVLKNVLLSSPGPNRSGRMDIVQYCYSKQFLVVLYITWIVIVDLASPRPYHTYSSIYLSLLILFLGMLKTGTNNIFLSHTCNNNCYNYLIFVTLPICGLISTKWFVLLVNTKPTCISDFLNVLLNVDNQFEWQHINGS